MRKKSDLPMKKKSENLKPDYKLDRAFHLTIYDLQGGPIPPEVIDRLEVFAEILAKENNLAVSSQVVTRD